MKHKRTAITPERLAYLVTANSQDPRYPATPTGRVAGPWVEFDESYPECGYSFWARPEGDSYTTVDALDPESGAPTAAYLDATLAADRMSLGLSAEPEIGEAWSRPKPSRWRRFVRWSRANAEREFFTIGAPLTCIWAVALGWVLGWDGMKAIAGLLVGWMF
ncbi:hypothetical protein HUT19_37640 [Streptomyces sp. NA02950]|uniref:hypothetical protein n=1 Tax=Streptomyces sp. NA02950 TaxID=2742137 RepID=UPI00159284C9|nr:hypothetical protein [Streptomyces sp. NA02950]QKV96718.1 hypothetical protein HUT19_37640 [Streptomyces sp. NA02950]